MCAGRPDSALIKFSPLKVNTNDLYSRALPGGSVASDARKQTRTASLLTGFSPDTTADARVHGWSAARWAFSARIQSSIKPGGSRSSAIVRAIATSGSVCTQIVASNQLLSSLRAAPTPSTRMISVPPGMTMDPERPRSIHGLRGVGQRQAIPAKRTQHTLDQNVGPSEKRVMPGNVVGVNDDDSLNASRDERSECRFPRPAPAVDANEQRSGARTPRQHEAQHV